MEPKHGCFPGSCSSCPQAGVANSLPEFGDTRYREFYSPPPHHNLSGKSGIFSLFLSQGYGCVTQADIHPSASSSGRDHRQVPPHPWDSLQFYHFLFVLFSFFLPRMLLGFLKRLNRTLIPCCWEQRCSHCWKTVPQLLKEFSRAVTWSSSPPHPP